MKQGTACLVAVYAWLHALKGEIGGRLTLTAVSDEETFGPNGARYLLEHHGSEVLGDCLLNAEPGAPTTVRFAEKAPLWIGIDIATIGAHGAYPHKTVDPIVIASRTVLSLQTIVARENNPLDPAVITVGSMHGGSKANIIPDEVTLQITVRSYKDDVRKHLLSAIERIAKAEAAAAGAPKEPTMALSDQALATVNDPALTKRVAGILSREFGESNVIEIPPKMVAEDFSVYGRAGVPAVIFWLGAVEPQKYEKATASGASLPSLHSSEFAPDRERTLRAGVSALTVIALDLLGKSSARSQGRRPTGSP